MERKKANSQKNHETFTISKWHKIDDIFEKFSVFLPPNPIKCAFLPLADIDVCVCVYVCIALSSASSSHNFSCEFNIIRFLFVGAVLSLLRRRLSGQAGGRVGWLGISKSQSIYAPHVVNIPFAFLFDDLVVWASGFFPT